GVHAFQIVAEPGDSSAPPIRRALGTAELYQLGLAQTLTLETLGASGDRLATMSGYFVAPDLVSTSFAAVNAAPVVRLFLPDQRRLDTGEVVAWNPREDWVVLRFAGAGGRAVNRATNALEVGDRCFFLDAQAEGPRVIVETTVVGRSPGGDLSLAQVAGEVSK